MTEADIRMARLLGLAESLACGGVQDLRTRALIVLSPHGAGVFSGVAQARAWLHEYATCGVYARRCFSDGCSCGVYIPASVSLPL